jgi:hypothetical protein
LQNQQSDRYGGHPGRYFGRGYNNENFNPSFGQYNNPYITSYNVNPNLAPTASYLGAGNWNNAIKGNGISSYPPQSGANVGFYPQYGNGPNSFNPVFNINQEANERLDEIRRTSNNYKRGGLLSWVLGDLFP